MIICLCLNICVYIQKTFSTKCIKNTYCIFFFRKLDLFFSIASCSKIFYKISLKISVHRKYNWVLFIFAQFCRWIGLPKKSVHSVFYFYYTLLRHLSKYCIVIQKLYIFWNCELWYRSDRECWKCIDIGSVSEFNSGASLGYLLRSLVPLMNKSRQILGELMH